jgi:hypothetical protein
MSSKLIENPTKTIRTNHKQHPKHATFKPTKNKFSQLTSTTNDGSRSTTERTQQPRIGLSSTCRCFPCDAPCLSFPEKEPAAISISSQIFLSFNLAIGYALTTASIFVPGMTMKGIAARLSLVSAAIFVLLIVTTELACKFQTCYCANGAQSLRWFG